MNYLQKELYDLVQTDRRIFDFLQQGSLDGLWYWDLENPEEEWMNERFWQTLGYDPDEMPHKASSWMEIIFPEDLALAQVNVGKHLADPANHPYDQLVRYQHHDGHTVYIRCRGLAVFNEQGMPTRMLGAHNDLTAIYQREKLLEESASLAQVGSWQINLLTNKVWWSAVTKSIHEVPADFEPELERGIEFYREGYSRDKINEVVQRGMESGEPWDEELQIITAKGNVRWVRAVGKPEFVNGKPVRLYGAFQDIDTRKTSQIKLQESEEQFRQVFESSAVGMALFDANGTLTRANATQCQIMGCELDDLIGQHFSAIIHPDDVPTEMERFRAFLEDNLPHQQLSFRTLPRNDKFSYVQGSITVLRDAEGNPTQFISQINDVTEQREARRKLATEREFLQKLIDNIPVNVYTKDRDGRRTLVNRSELKFFGAESRDELLGRGDHDLFAPEAAEEARREDLRVLNGEIDMLTLEKVVHSPVLGERNLFVSKLPLFDTEGNINGLLGLAYDVTADRLAQERLRHLTVLESKAREMEQFAFIASHDLREPVITIKGYSDLILEEYGEQLGAEGRQFAKVVLDSANRMDLLIRDLLTYSRLSQIKEFKPVDMNEVMEEIVEDMAGTIEKTQAEIKIGPLPTLPGHKLRLKQLLQNLVSNGIKFRKEHVPPKIRISAKNIDGGWEFKVKDNGIGIAEKDHEQIFSLFKRLHQQRTYEGTGIGLANCKKVVETHNGEIWVDSVEGEYAAFHFTLRTKNQND